MKAKGRTLAAAKKTKTRYTSKDQEARYM